eukprot:TRINITY_DN895_c0_g2_i1.p1 TRINITY_DN895_c0_g2~~TRINITY_DN895_c0_g2_i1.p1  ORF type:complete len:999 (-),score=248.54 TRINITY_DN895_c0_g2_i1:3227-6223(-)
MNTPEKTEAKEETDDEDTLPEIETPPPRPRVFSEPKRRSSSTSRTRSISRRITMKKLTKDPEELTRQFEEVLEAKAYSNTEKDSFRNATLEQKFSMITEHREAEKKKLTPKEYISGLKKKPHDIIEKLVITIKSEPSDFADEFIQQGGLKIMASLMEEALEKCRKYTSQPKHGKSVLLLQNLILAVKSIGNHEDVIHSLLKVPKLLELILASLEVVSDRMKIVIFHILAAVSIIDPVVHNSLLPLVQRDIMIFLSSACSVNPEVAAAAFCCLNAMVISDKHDLPQRDILRRELLQKGLVEIAQEWQRRKDIAESMRTQLSIFETGVGINLQLDDVYAENPRVLFEKLTNSTRGTAVFDKFVSILHGLQRVPIHGKAGFNAWDMINSFIACATTIGSKELSNRTTGLETMIAKLREYEKSSTTSKFHRKLNNDVNSMGKLKAELDYDDLLTHDTAKKLDKTVEDDDDQSTSIISTPSKFTDTTQSVLSTTITTTTSDVSVKSTDATSTTSTSTNGSTHNISHHHGHHQHSNESTTSTSTVPTTDPGSSANPSTGGPPPPPGPPSRLPPPPPGARVVQTKKQTCLPNSTVKMKPIYWNKLVPKNLSKTIWDKMKEDIIIPSEFLESEFSVTATTSTPVNKKKSENNNKTLILLDAKRWQNISIMLTRFSGLEFADIKDAILNLDETVFRTEDIQVLIPFSPQKEEIELLSPYKKDPPSNLGKPEKFFVEIIDIPDVKARLECWNYKMTFPAKFVEIKASVETLLRACKEVKDNNHFIKVLEVVLAFGNFFNGNTNRGGAFGFKIELLPKLADIKSRSDPKISLLHSLIEFVDDKYPECSHFYQHFLSIEKASMLQMSAIQEEMTSIKDGLLLIDSFVASPASEPGRFKEIMEKFIPTATQLIKKLSELFKKGQQIFEELCLLYDENPDTCSLDQLFGTFHQFSLLYKKTKSEIEQRKILEEKEKERQREALHKKKIQQKGEKSLGVIDQVLADITSGQVF